MMQQRLSKQVEIAEKEFKQGQNPKMRINNSNSSYKNDAISNNDNREDFNPYA
jgi:hypothetical protein